MINEELEKRLKESIFFVKATMWEISQLQTIYLAHKGVKWIKDPQNFYRKIGCIKDDPDLPIHVSFAFARINGQQICFYNPSGLHDDFILVQTYLMENYPVKWNNKTELAMGNPSYFQHVITAIREANQGSE